MLGNLAQAFDEGASSMSPSLTTRPSAWSALAPASAATWATLCAIAPELRAAMVIGEPGSGKTLLTQQLQARSAWANAPLLSCALASTADPLVMLSADSHTQRVVHVTGVQHLSIAEQLRIAAWLQRMPATLAVIFEVPVRDASWLQSPRWAPALITACAAQCLAVPAFDARTADLVPIAHAMLAHYAQLWGRQPPLLCDDAAHAVERAAYRDNGYTLQQAMAHAVLHHTTHAVALQHLPASFAGRADRASAMGIDAVALEEMVGHKLTQFFERLGSYDVRDLYNTVLAKVERPLFRLALEHAGGNQVRAARMLGLNRNTLRTRLRALGVHPEDAA